MSLDISNLTKAEMDELLEFSNDKTNIVERYIVACQIITNLIDDGEGYLYNQENWDDNVDLTICKLLLDGDIVIEPEERKLH
jgi:hypothetical protein